jgi:hypothetical protein
MHIQQLKNIAKDLREIAQKVTPPNSFPFRLHDGIAYCLPNDAVIQFNQLINSILKQQDFKSKFSDKYIEKQLKAVFAKLLQSEDFDLEKSLSTLIATLDEFNDKTEVYIKVDGVDLSFCFTLGRAKFSPGDEYLLNYIEMKAWNIIKQTKNTDDEKVAAMEITTQTIKKEFKGGCVAIVKVDAEPIRAREIAKEEVGRAIDLLRFTSKALHPSNEDIRFGMKGDFPKSKRQIYAISENSLSPETDSIGSTQSLRIDANAMVKMNDIGVFALSKALQKQKTTQYEECLIKSVHWFSVSLTQNENCNSFLFMIVALEALFKPPYGSSISSTISESVALLLDKRLKQRKNIVKQMREFYGKRSAVAHGGSKNLTDIDLHILMSLVGQTLMICINKTSEFSSQEDLMTFIEEIKFSDGLEDTREDFVQDGSHI